MHAVEITEGIEVDIDPSNLSTSRETRTYKVITTMVIRPLDRPI